MFFSDDGGHAKSVRQLATAFSPMSASQEGYVANDNIKSDLAGLLRQHAPQSCFVQLCDMRPFPKPKKVDCPPCPKSVALSLGHPATTEELTQAMALTEAQRESLNIATMKQSESSEWLDQRHGRITASNFHRVCTRMRTLQDNSSADPSALISSLMGYLPELKTVAVKHGKAMEPHAKKAYQKLQKAYHRKFSSEDSGLLIHRTLPYVGASPDLLVSCCCGESKCPPKGICEIKCPESIKDQAPTCKNWSHLVEKDGVTSLKKTSLYYTQVQGQMAVAGVNYCDFFVYTDKGHHLERIMFDYDFWEEKEKLLTEFWRQYLSKELIFSSLANTITIREENVLSDHSYHGNPVSADLALANQPSTSGVLKAKRGPLLKPKMPLVYMCGKCGGDLVDEPDNIQDESVECSKCQMWYHTRCVQLSNVDNVSGAIKWHCYQCADV